MTQELFERIRDTRAKAREYEARYGREALSRLSSAEYVALFDPHEGGLVPFEQILFREITVDTGKSAR